MRPSPDEAPGRWLDVAVVMSFAALMLQRFTHHVDLHIADEVMYQLQGRALLDGEIGTRTLAYNPVYSAAYALLQLLPLHGPAVQDAMGVVAVAASTLAAWWCVAAFVSRPAALLAAAWWGSSLLVLGYSLRMYVFSSALYFAAAALAGRGRIPAALAVLSAAALGRTEVLPWLLGAAAGVLWVGWRRRAPGLRRAGALFVAVGAGLAVLAAVLPEARQHSWFAFSWHFSGNTVNPGAPPPGGVPAAAPLLERTFPGADSVLGALRANPGALARHALRNAPYVPGMAAHFIADPFDHVTAEWFRRWPALQVALRVLVALAILGGAVAARRRGTAEPAAPRRAAGVVVLGSSMLVVPPLLAFFPRSDVLLPIAPLLLVLAARGAASAAGLLVRITRARLPAPWVLAAGCALGLAAVCGGPFVQTPASPRPARAAVALLQREGIEAGARVMALHGRPMLALAGLDATPVETETAMAHAVENGELAADWALLTTWEYGLPHLDALIAELATPAWRLAGSTENAWLFARTRPR